MRKDSNGRGHWPGALALGSLSFLARGGEGNFAAWAAATGFAIATFVALGLFFHARTQPPCWQLERKTGREFYRRQQHTLLGISSVYWALPFSFASMFLAWLAVKAR